MALVNDPLDLLLTNDDIVVTDDIQFVSGLAGVAQAISLRIRTFKGEWFLDLDEGVPYYEDILGQKFSEAKVRAAFRSIILDTQNVKSMISMSVEFDGATRVTTVNWEVNTEFGDTAGSTSV